MSKPITLDFENNGAMTLDDISFGPPEVITEEAPKGEEAKIEPAPTPEPTPAPVAAAAQEEKKEEEPTEKLTLEDVSFEGAGTVGDPVLGADGEAAEEGKEVEINEDLKLAAIRAVISKKLERHQLEAEIDLNDLTEEQLVEFEEEVDNTILEAKYSQVKSVDSRVETILNYLESGGDPKKITSLFQERDLVDTIDVTTKEGQISLIKSYYKNVKNLSPEDATKRVDKLDAAGLLEEEAKDIKVEYDAHNEQKVQEELERQKQAALIREQNDNKKRVIFEKALKDNGVSGKLLDDLRRVAFGEGILPNKEKVKILDYKIMQMQSDPESFYKLSLFLADPVKYEENIIQAAKNKVVTTEMKKGFNMETKVKSGVEKAQTSSGKEKTKVKFNFN